MHELPLIQDVLNVALTEAAKVGAGRVTHARLVIEPLSDVSPEAVRFYWQMLAQGTPCADTALEFNYPPVNLECRACGHTFQLPPEEVDQPLLHPAQAACPVCASPQVQLLSGHAFYLESIDVET